MSTNPRDRILESYDVKDGRIVSPGKFEGEPIFAPYYWNAVLDGLADDDDGETWTFDLTSDDHVMWPELKEQNWGDVLMLSTDEQGFVRCR